MKPRITIEDLQEIAKKSGRKFKEFITLDEYFSLLKKYLDNCIVLGDIESVHNLKYAKTGNDEFSETKSGHLIEKVLNKMCVKAYLEAENEKRFIEINELSPNNSRINKASLKKAILMVDNLDMAKRLSSRSESIDFKNMAYAKCIYLCKDFEDLKEVWRSLDMNNKGYRYERESVIEEGKRLIDLKWINLCLKMLNESNSIFDVIKVLDLTGEKWKKHNEGLSYPEIYEFSMIKLVDIAETMEHLWIVNNTVPRGSNNDLKVKKKLAEKCSTLDELNKLDCCCCAIDHGEIKEILVKKGQKIVRDSLKKIDNLEKLNGLKIPNFVDMYFEVLEKKEIISKAMLDKIDTIEDLESLHYLMTGDMSLSKIVYDKIISKTKKLYEDSNIEELPWDTDYYELKDILINRRTDLIILSIKQMENSEEIKKVLEDYPYGHNARFSCYKKMILLCETVDDVSDVLKYSCGGSSYENFEDPELKEVSLRRIVELSI